MSFTGSVFNSQFTETLGFSHTYKQMGITTRHIGINTIQALLGAVLLSQDKQVSWFFLTEGFIHISTAKSKQQS